MKEWLRFRWHSLFSETRNPEVVFFFFFLNWMERQLQKPSSYVESLWMIWFREKLFFLWLHSILVKIKSNLSHFYQTKYKSFFWQIMWIQSSYVTCYRETRSSIDLELVLENTPTSHFHWLIQTQNQNIKTVVFSVIFSREFQKESKIKHFTFDEFFLKFELRAKKYFFLEYPKKKLYFSCLIIFL